jgi:hypothetical protein
MSTVVGRSGGSFGRDFEEISRIVDMTLLQKAVGYPGDTSERKISTVNVDIRRGASICVVSTNRLFA